jgi:hypothetical protein
VYQDSQQHYQHEPSYAADWSSLQLDFSEFLNQDFTQYELPGGYSAVSQAPFDIDFEALLASTSTCDPHSTTATTTTDSSATLTPSDLSSRQDNVLTFDAPITALTQPFETTSSFDTSPESEHVSPLSRPSARTIGPLMIDLPTSIESLPTGHQLQAGRPTPPPSVYNASSSSKTTSPPIAARAAPASPSISDSPEEGPDSRKRKRERNTEAARRYRQRRQDRLEELEEALAAMQKERDDLRIKLARSEAETDILRGLMAKK